jgi:hypothetical protein
VSAGWNRFVESSESRVVYLQDFLLLLDLLDKGGDVLD